MRLIKWGNVYISVSMASLFSGSYHVRPNCHLLWVHSVPRVFALQKIFTDLSQPLKTTFFSPNLKTIFKYTIRLYWIHPTWYMCTIHFTTQMSKYCDFVTTKAWPTKVWIHLASYSHSQELLVFSLFFLFCCCWICKCLQACQRHLRLNENCGMSHICFINNLSTWTSQTPNASTFKPCDEGWRDGPVELSQHLVACADDSLHTLGRWPTHFPRHVIVVTVLIIALSENTSGHHASSTSHLVVSNSNSQPCNLLVCSQVTELNSLFWHIVDYSPKDLISDK